MTPEDFRLWLETMQEKGLATSDAHCARLLGVSANSVVTMKKQGADLRTAYACNAILNGLPAFGAAAPAEEEKAPPSFPKPKFRILDDDEAEESAA